MTLDKCRFYSQEYPNNTLIALDGAEVIGFLGYGNFRDAGSQAGEIYALYVLRDYYGTGIGQALMEAALSALADFPEIYLWVLAENHRAKAFYQKLGFVFDGVEKLLELGDPVKEMRMKFEKGQLK